MKIKHNKEASKKYKYAIASQHGDSLNFRMDDGTTLLIRPDGSAYNCKSLNFEEECKDATYVFYPGDSITLDF